MITARMIYFLRAVFLFHFVNADSFLEKINQIRFSTGNIPTCGKKNISPI